MIQTESPTEAGLPVGKAARSLPEQLAERLLAEVLAGRLRPGDRLKEEELSQRHAVSRATVREALLTLTKQGHVVRVPRFGARVAEFSRQDVDDLFELRAVLLGAAARRCARRRDAVHLAALQTLVAELAALAADPATDPQQFATLSIRAQTHLIEWSGNRHLPSVYERLASMGAWQLIRGRATSFLMPEWRVQSAADWRHLVECIARGDSDASERAARRLLEHSAKRVRTHIDETVRLERLP